MSFKFKAIIACSLLMCAAPSAFAQTSTPAQRYDAATKLILAKLGPAQEFRAPPAETDPGVAQSLADIKASMAVFGTDAFPIDGMTTFQSVCAPLAAMTVQYAMAGANTLDPKADPAIQASKLATLENANAEKYQDTLMIFGVGDARCAAMHLPFIANFWNSVPAAERTQTRIGGLRQMQSGMSQILMGLVMTSIQSPYSQKNRDLAITTAATYVGAFSDGLTIDDRNALLATITQPGLGLSKAYPKEYAIIVGALSQSACSGLCTVG